MSDSNKNTEMMIKTVEDLVGEMDTKKLQVVALLEQNIDWTSIKNSSVVPDPSTGHIPVNSALVTIREEVEQVVIQFEGNLQVIRTKVT